MSARQPRQPKATMTMAAVKDKVMQRPTACKNSCGCENEVSTLSQPLLHMDDCDDPYCADLEQLNELQKSLDRFTDYSHYEKCCDRKHAAGEECNTNNCCQNLTNDASCDDCVDLCAEDCVDDCDDCVEDHPRCSPGADGLLDAGTPVKCDDDCMQCEEECEEQGHERKDCPQDHHTSWESCFTTCGQCFDPAPLPMLPLDAELQLHDLNNYLPHVTPCDERCTPPPLTEDYLSLETMLQPQSQFDVALDHWQTFQNAHHCAPDPCMINQLPELPPPQHIDPQFGFSFGCDPTTPGNQYPWQQQESMQQSCKVQAFHNLDLSALASNVNVFTPVDFNFPEQSTNPGQILTDLAQRQVSPDRPAKQPSPAPKTGKSCQWLMPCGSICGQTFARTDDLKKHVKNSHLSLKGTVTCRWGSACTASFATEAALTGHISKKHLAPLYAQSSAAALKADSKSPGSSESVTAEELPWKCTYPSCTKSFMYKQVRDDHALSHTGGNMSHCPICHRWLNSEGSNFRRHLASHRPEHEHMECKHKHLGCRRKFPRLDNLRRHEACCKYGKKAAEKHHHHHHHHHHGHSK